MKWWIMATAIQLIIHFIPPKDWKWIYARTRCWIKGCICQKYYTPQEATPQLKRIIEDEMMKLDFINTAWNLYEEKSYTRMQRVVKNIMGYFNGYKGP